MNHEKFLAWVEEPVERLAKLVQAGELATTEDETEAEERIAAVRFVRQVIGRGPDFGEVLSPNSRRITVPGTTLALTWTFSPSERTYEIIIPFLAPLS